MSDDGAIPRGTLGTVRNASLLLDLLSQGSARHQLSELAVRSGLSLPTVHRLLRSLVVAGMVEQDVHSSRYGLGPELVRLSERYLERQPLLQILGPYLTDLRSRTTASTAVALLVRDEVVYVERVEGAEVGLFQRQGRTFPAGSTAAGRLLLGRAEPEVLAACTRRMGEDGPSDAEIKEWGDAAHLISDAGPAGDIEAAVPVIGHGGRTVAALVATGAPPGLSRSQMVDEVVPLLRHIAAQAGRVLGNA